VHATYAGGSALNSTLKPSDLAKTHNIKMVDLWEDDGPAVAINASAGAIYEEFLFKNEALRVIREIGNASTPTPMFLYYAAHIVHLPLEVPASYNDSFNFISDKTRRTYHAMVKCIDDVLGEIVMELKKQSMWGNTFLVLSTDNGGPIGTSTGTTGTATAATTATNAATAAATNAATGPIGRNAGANNFPLRGGKYSNFEGGVRGTAFASGGLIPAKMQGTQQRNPGDGHCTSYVHILGTHTLCAIYSTPR
jgi:arylsulfatase I/J